MGINEGDGFVGEDRNSDEITSRLDRKQVKKSSFAFGDTGCNKSSVTSSCQVPGQVSIAGLAWGC